MNHEIMKCNAQYFNIATIRDTNPKYKTHFPSTTPK